MPHLVFLLSWPLLLVSTCGLLSCPVSTRLCRSPLHGLAAQQACTSAAQRARAFIVLSSASVTYYLCSAHKCHAHLFIIEGAFL